LIVPAVVVVPVAHPLALLFLGPADILKFNDFKAFGGLRPSFNTKRDGTIAHPILNLALAPTLWEERAEAGKTLDVVRPAFHASPRKEDAVYHRFHAQGQTQFLCGEDAEQSRRLG
jgi:hypothetical protein